MNQNKSLNKSVHINIHEVSLLKSFQWHEMNRNALTDKWLISLSGVENGNYNSILKCILILCVFL